MAGSLDAQVSLDFLSSTSTNEGPGAGPEINLSAHELGFRARAHLRELDNKLHFYVDYHDREPVAGTFQNSAQRLLYRAELRYSLLPTLKVGIGRFLPPTTIFAPTDGVNLQFHTGSIEIGAYGGRRAIDSSRKNVDFSTVLPSVGGWASYTTPRVFVNANISYTSDVWRVASATNSLKGEAGGVSGSVRAQLRPIDMLIFGGQASLNQAVTYSLGPTWTDAELKATALGLFSASGWASFRPASWARLELDLLHQNVQSYRAGRIDAGGSFTEDAFIPSHTDARVRVRIGPPSIGWLRPMLRYRIRGDRTELRTGLRFNVYNLVVPGLYLSAQGTLDNISGTSQKDDIGSRDRTYGSAGLGFRKFGLDAKLGASYVARAAKPVSGRVVRPGSPSDPSKSDDLQPFTLEADPIMYARIFYSSQRWFAGADIEKHLTEPEFRAFLQVGILMEAGW